MNNMSSETIERYGKTYYNFIVEDITYKYNKLKSEYNTCIEADELLINRIKETIAQKTVDVNKNMKDINMNISFVIPKQHNRIVLIEDCRYCEHLEQNELYFVSKNLVNLTRTKKIRDIVSE
jgi:uncharacterized FlaG/YvyC family protein